MDDTLTHDSTHARADPRIDMQSADSQSDNQADMSTLDASLAETFPASDPIAPGHHADSDAPPQALAQPGSAVTQTDPHVFRFPTSRPTAPRYGNRYGNEHPRSQSTTSVLMALTLVGAGYLIGRNASGQRRNSP